MARRTVTVTITAEGRDQGKAFLLTELSAAQAEKWAARALLALGQSGVSIPDDIAAAGLAGVATLGVRAFAGVPWHLAEPLLDEMMTCVALIPDPARPQIVVNGSMLMGQIEEIATLVRLREEVISLHLGFSLAGYISKFRTTMAPAMAGNTPDTETSPEPLAP